ncbi:hypothetical protein GCM10010191_53120 [Actinomadura vinacea]|uniref:Uncharacterized protein n=1 Tax=Actinomadura vinacea TaxID=115336 RepID=A0ABN3JJQ9_9ACTN
MTLRRIVLALGAEGYGSRAQLFQDAMQRGLEDVLARAAERAGLRRDEWWRQDTEGGELSVLPLDESEDAVVGAFVPELNSELAQHNRLVAEDARLRLRLAIHFGPATRSSLGFSGDGPVLAAWLCRSRPLLAALEQTDCALAVLLSYEIYTGTVEALRIPLDPERTRRVRVREPGRDVDAWLWLPGRTPNDVRLGTAAAGGGPVPEKEEEGPGGGAGAAGAPPPVHRESFTGAKIITTGPVIGGDQLNIHHHGSDHER